MNNSLVFDVGLNIGKKSEIFLSQGARVIGFEPQKPAFETAVKILSKYKNFHAENVGLSYEEGEKNIYISSANTLSSMSEQFISITQKNRFKNYTWNSTPKKIQVSTLDNMIKKYGIPKYIKIDTEGYEYEVLRGLSQKIEYISIEFTPELYINTDKCLNYLYHLSNQQCFFNYINQENQNYYFSKWLNIYDIKKYLMSINNLYEFGDIYIQTKIN